MRSFRSASSRSRSPARTRPKPETAAPQPEKKTEAVVAEAEEDSSFLENVVQGRTRSEAPTPPADPPAPPAPPTPNSPLSGFTSAVVSAALGQSPRLTGAVQATRSLIDKVVSAPGPSNLSTSLAADVAPAVEAAGGSMSSVESVFKEVDQLFDGFATFEKGTPALVANAWKAAETNIHSTFSNVRERLVSAGLDEAVVEQTFGDWETAAQQQLESTVRSTNSQAQVDRAPSEATSAEVFKEVETALPGVTTTIAAPTVDAATTTTAPGAPSHPAIAAVEGRQPDALGAYRPHAIRTPQTNATSFKPGWNTTGSMVRSTGDAQNGQVQTGAGAVDIKKRSANWNVAQANWSPESWRQMATQGNVSLANQSLHGGWQNASGEGDVQRTNQGTVQGDLNDQNLAWSQSTSTTTGSGDTLPSNHWDGWTAANYADAYQWVGPARGATLANNEAGTAQELMALNGIGGDITTQMLADAHEHRANTVVQTTQSQSTSGSYDHTTGVGAANGSVSRGTTMGDGTIQQSSHQGGVAFDTTNERGHATVSGSTSSTHAPGTAFLGMHSEDYGAVLGEELAGTTNLNALRDAILKNGGIDGLDADPAVLEALQKHEGSYQASQVTGSETQYSGGVSMDRGTGQTQGNGQVTRTTSMMDGTTTVRGASGTVHANSEEQLYGWNLGATDRMTPGETRGAHLTDEDVVSRDRSANFSGSVDADAGIWSTGVDVDSRIERNDESAVDRSVSVAASGNQETGDYTGTVSFGSSNQQTDAYVYNRFGMLDDMDAAAMAEAFQWVGPTRGEALANAEIDSVEDLVGVHGVGQDIATDVLGQVQDYNANTQLWRSTTGSASGHYNTETTAWDGGAQFTSDQRMRDGMHHQTTGQATLNGNVDENQLAFSVTGGRTSEATDSYEGHELSSLVGMSDEEWQAISGIGEVRGEALQEAMLTATSFQELYDADKIGDGTLQRLLPDVAAHQADTIVNRSTTGGVTGEVDTETGAFTVAGNGNHTTTNAQGTTTAHGVNGSVQADVASGTAAWNGTSTTSITRSEDYTTPLWAGGPSYADLADPSAVLTTERSRSFTGAYDHEAQTLTSSVGYANQTELHDHTATNTTFDGGVSIDAANEAYSGTARFHRDNKPGENFETHTYSAYSDLSEQELQALQWVGPVRAEALSDGLNDADSVEDLLAIDGIGPNIATQIVAGQHAHASTTEAWRSTDVAGNASYADGTFTGNASGTQDILMENGVNHRSVLNGEITHNQENGTFSASVGGSNATTLTDAYAPTRNEAFLGMQSEDYQEAFGVGEATGDALVASMLTQDLDPGALLEAGVDPEVVRALEVHQADHAASTVRTSQSTWNAGFAQLEDGVNLDLSGSQEQVFANGVLSGNATGLQVQGMENGSSQVSGSYSSWTRPADGTSQDSLAGLRLMSAEELADSTMWVGEARGDDLVETLRTAEDFQDLVDIPGVGPVISTNLRDNIREHDANTVLASQTSVNGSAGFDAETETFSANGAYSSETTMRNGVTSTSSFTGGFEHNQATGGWNLSLGTNQGTSTTDGYTYNELDIIRGMSPDELMEIKGIGEHKATLINEWAGAYDTREELAEGVNGLGSATMDKLEPIIAEGMATTEVASQSHAHGVVGYDPDSEQFRLGVNGGLTSTMANGDQHLGSGTINVLAGEDTLGVEAAGSWGQTNKDGSGETSTLTGGVSIDREAELYATNWAYTNQTTGTNGEATSQNVSGNVNYDANAGLFTGAGQYASTQRGPTRTVTAEDGTTSEFADSSSTSVGVMGSYNHENGAWMVGANGTRSNTAHGDDGKVTAANTTEAAIMLGQTAGDHWQAAGSGYVTTQDRGRTGAEFTYMLDPETQSGTLGGGAMYNGTGGSATVTMVDGEVAGVGATAMVAGQGADVDVLHTDDQTRIAVEASTGSYGGGISYDNIHGRAMSGVESEGNASRMMGGSVMTVGTMDQLTLGGSASAGVYSIEGGYTTGSSVEMLAARPEGLSPEEEKAWSEAAASQLPQGMSDVDVNTMAAGTGFRFRTNNGWNAGGGAGVGIVGLSGSVDSTSANEVTMVHDGQQLVVNLRTASGIDPTVGANVAGMVGLEGAFTNDDVSDFEFAVDPNSPEALAALETFTETGLLPGALDIQTESAVEARSAYDDAHAAVTSSTEALAELDATFEANGTTAEIAMAEYQEAIASPVPGMVIPHEAEVQKLLGIQRDLDQANATINDSRDTLNAAWSDHYDVGQGPSIPGITVTRTSDVSTRGADLNATSFLGNVNLAGNTETHGETRYLNDETGEVEHQFDFTEEERGLFRPDERFSVTANTGGQAFSMQMSSEARLNNSREMEVLRGIGNNSDVPDYVLDAYVERNLGVAAVDRLNFLQHDAEEGMYGVMDVNLQDADLMVVANALNNGEDAEAMWGRMGANAARLFDEPADYTDAIPLHEAMGIDLPSGMTADQVQEQLTGMDNPEAFAALDPEVQSVAVQAMVASSGPDNPYQAVAAIGTVEDEALRAELFTQMFEGVKDNGMWLSGHDDPVMLFAEFAQDMNDPAVDTMLQEAVQFELKDDRVEAAKQLTPEEQATQLVAAHHQSKGPPWASQADPDTTAQLSILRAAHETGGGAGVVSLLENAGVDPQAMLDQFNDDPTRAQWAHDILLQSGVDVALHADLGPERFVDLGVDGGVLDLQLGGSQGVSNTWDRGVNTMNVGGDNGFSQSIDYNSGERVRTFGDTYYGSINFRERSTSMNLGGANGFGYDVNWNDRDVNLNVGGQVIDVDQTARDAVQSVQTHVQNGVDTVRTRVSDGVDTARDRVQEGVANTRERASEGWNQFASNVSGRANSVRNGWNSLWNRGDA